MSSNSPGNDSAERAIWGLVNDRYDLAGRTAGLTDDEAWRLSRAPDAGDPGSKVENAIAYLNSDFGPLYARYYTNSKLDSAGRLTMVYDVVRPSAAQVREARGNPFRIASTLPSSGSIEESGTLRSPVLAPEINEAQRLAELLQEEDRDALTDVLAAVLAGGPTLWTSKTSRLKTIEALVLLLPPELRQHFTFQSFTLKASNSQPRLTVAEEILSPHKDGRWQFSLPRDRAQIPAAAREAARALVSLAQDVPRHAHARQELSQQFANGASVHENLLVHIEQLLRFDQLEVVRSNGDFVGGLRLLSSATSAQERLHMTAAIAGSISGDVWADGAADAIERYGDHAWIGLRRFAVALFHQQPDSIGKLGLLTHAVAARDVAHPESTEERGTRTVLAAIAAVANQVNEFVVLSSGPLNFDALDEMGNKTNLVNRAASKLTILARAIFQSNSLTISNTASLLDALAAVAPLNGRASKRAAHIGYAAVSGLLRDQGLQLTRDDLVAIEAALSAFWRQYPASVEPTLSLHAFLQSAAMSAPAEENRLGRTAAAALLQSNAALSASELLGWARLLLSRDSRSLSSHTRLAAFLECGKGLPGFVAGISAMIPPVADEMGLAILDPDWLRIGLLADKATMTPYFVKALAKAIEQAAGQDSVGSIVDACIALADQKTRLSLATGAPVILALKEYSNRAVDKSDAIRLRICCTVVENISDDEFSDRIAIDIWSGDNPTALRGRLWLLAGALRIVERTRPAGEMGLLKDRLQQGTNWKNDMPTSFVNSLVQFFGLRKSSARRGMWQRSESESQTAETT